MVQKKKSQGLPLNTIILFIIVVVVLVITIVWFVNKFDSNSHKIDNTSGGVTSCSNDNPILSNSYSNVVACPSQSNSEKTPGAGCSYIDNNFTSCASGYTRIIGVTVPNGYSACCGIKK